MSTAQHGYPQGYPQPGQQQAPQAYPGQAPQGQAPAPQGYAPAPQGYPQQQAYPGQAPQGYAPQQAPQQKAPSTVIEVIRSNYTTISLFEVSGGFDPGLKFPKSLCFVLGVPGVKDATKQSGRSYNQSGKINMKFSTQEIRSLGQSLINLSMWKQGVPAFEKHSDPSKNSFSQGQGDQNTKKLVAKFDVNKSNIAITMNYGGLNVLIPVPLQDALGLGHDLINIGNVADLKLAEYKMANRIGREEVEMPEHIQLEETPGYPGQAIPQGYAPAPQQGYPGQAPQAQAPQGYAPAPQAQAPVPQYAPAPQQGYPGQAQAPQGYPQGYPGAQ